MLTHDQQTGAPTRSCTELARLPRERIAANALEALKVASLTGFAPLISGLRDRRVGWTTLQGRKWWERRVLPSRPLACQTSALLLSYAPENGAGERNRTVVSAVARPHSAVEPHPQTGVPSRTLTGNRALRMRLLYTLSYGDKGSNPWPVSSTG